MNSRAISTENNGVLRSPIRQLRNATLGVLSLLMFMVIQQDAFAADAAKGLVLFQANCARCHSTNLQVNSTGPGLFGVMERVPSEEWLYPWIKNSAAVIETGDDYAVQVWEANNKGAMSAMPHLTDGDIGDIIQWIKDWTPPVDDTEGGAAYSSFDEDTGLTSLRNAVILLIFIVVGLLGFIALQVAKLRGVDFLAGVNWDKINARLFLGFFILGMIGVVGSIMVYNDYFLFDNAASEHGAEIDDLFWTTMAVVMFVFVLTNAVLFFFAYKYGKDGGRKAKFYPENHKLEMIWTVVPAIVLTILIIFGIRTWTDTMGTPDDDDLLTIEISGEQWGWNLRYAGDDAKLGDIDVRLIGGSNIIGVDTTDPLTADDFLSNDLVLMKGRRTDLKIRSRDVLHSVYLPHFRVKMDAVPGMNTRFHFLPTKTTEEYRQYLKETKPYYNVIDTIITQDIVTVDIVNGDSIKTTQSVTDTIYLYDKFNYELACTEVCGRGHFSMRKTVKVLEPEAWYAWYDSIKVNNMAAVLDYGPQENVKPGTSEGDMADRAAARKEESILE